MPSHGDQVIHTELLPRACGCVLEFRHYDRDPFRRERREKFGRTRCPPCGEKANAEHNARQETERPSGGKQQQIDRVPRGAVIELTRDEDSGEWHGSLSFNGFEVEVSGGSPMSMVNRLARKWLRVTGQGEG